eukprot:14156348-Alexandrium_andersonii.AAC.1
MIEADIAERAKQQGIYSDRRCDALDVLPPAMQIRFETYEHMYNDQLSQARSQAGETPKKTTGRPIWDLEQNPASPVSMSALVPTALTHSTL